MYFNIYKLFEVAWLNAWLSNIFAHIYSYNSGLYEYLDNNSGIFSWLTNARFSHTKKFIQLSFHIT